jgi:hypothetical protein
VGYDYFGHDIRQVAASSYLECCQLCSLDGNCPFWSFNLNNVDTPCYFKNSDEGRGHSANVTSGICPSSLPTDPAGSHSHEVQLPATVAVKLMRVK